MIRMSSADVETLRTLTEKAEALRGVIDDINSFMDRIYSSASDYYEARTDRWKRSKKGEAYLDWLDRMEFSLFDMDGMVDCLKHIGVEPMDILDHGKDQK